MCRASLLKPKGPSVMPPRKKNTPFYIAIGVLLFGGVAYWSMTHQTGVDTVAPSTLSITDLDHKGDVAFQEKDYKEALLRYHQAADKGDLLAQNFVGWIYQNGLGVPADPKQALMWYHKAADKGYSPSETNVGWCYQNGLGVKTDYGEAIVWYKKAVAQGNESAEINMGYLYENGIGVTKDLDAAKKWYQMAAKNGNQEAKKDLDMLEAKRVNLNAIMNSGTIAGQ